MSRTLTPFALTALAAAFSSNASAGILSPDLEEQMRGANADDLVRAIVMLPDQFDKAGFVEEMRSNDRNMHQRHIEAVTRLRTLSRSRQQDLVNWLNLQLLADEVTDYRPLWITNGVIVTATERTLRSIANRTDVEIVYPDYPISLIDPIEEMKVDDRNLDVDQATGSTPPAALGVEEGISSTRAPELWALGFDGTGAIVADMDTGADGDHPAFASRYLGLRKPASQCWFDPVTNTTFPVEFGWVSHGTHTLGTMCGSEGTNQIGMAPGAEWIAAAVIDRVSIERTIADAILSFEWFADPDGDPFTSDDVPAVVNNSWGISPIWHGVPHCDNTFWNSIDNCEAAGAAVVFAAGNEGPGSKTLRTPADRIAGATTVFSVGALLSGSNDIASFSSRGPSGCDNATIKPEVTARGDDVRSSVDGGGYGTLSGTSMASPHVAGAVALLKSARPDATPEELKEALLNTAVDLGSAGEDNTYGMGRIDVVAALDYLGGAGGQILVSIDPATDPLRVPSAGGPVDFDWTLTNEGEQEELFEEWLMATPDGGIDRLVWGPANDTLGPLEIETGSARISKPEWMNGSVPDGYYWLRAEVGEYTGHVADSDAFRILKGDLPPIVIDFDDLEDGSPVAGQVPGVSFSPGWTVWNADGNSQYPPHSLPNVVFTHETNNWIRWGSPIDDLQLFVSCNTGYSDGYAYTAYDSVGTVLEEITTAGGEDLPIVFSASGISMLKVKGRSLWHLGHTLDDLAWSAP
ncbi:MAG: hypothetical protein CME06_16690 [Gemmatimonadetes bacterium]|nr:hypothetical protein [Gemmatimonadota bacterium]